MFTANAGQTSCHNKQNLTASEANHRRTILPPRTFELKDSTPLLVSPSMDFDDVITEIDSAT